MRGHQLEGEVRAKKGRLQHGEADGEGSGQRVHGTAARGDTRAPTPAAHGSRRVTDAHAVERGDDAVHGNRQGEDQERAPCEQHVPLSLLSRLRTATGTCRPTSPSRPRRAKYSTAASSAQRPLARVGYSTSRGNPASKTGRLLQPFPGVGRSEELGKSGLETLGTTRRLSWWLHRRRL